MSARVKMLADNGSRRSKRLRRGSSSKLMAEEDAELKKKKKNEYCGYKLTNSGSTDDAIETLKEEISASHFFEQYVSTRKPVILNFYPSFPVEETAASSRTDCNNTEPSSSLMWSVTEAVLQSVAGLELVQVEKRRHVMESFGQPRTNSRQILMKLNEFLDCLRRGTSKDNVNNPELYYLSPQQQPQTQHQKDDDPETNSFQTPCLQLVQNRYIPSTLPIAGNMALHSCNLWMGTSIEGSSSGLHHDFHDNFYILLNGSKRFKLFSPDTAQYMRTRGIIDRVYSNGLISYVGSEARSDGVPLVLLCATSEDVTNPSNNRQLDNNSSSEKSINETDDEIENEEEIVIGCGFDYKSTDEEEGEHVGAYEWDNEMHDDYDESEEQDDCFAPADNFSLIPSSTLQDKGRLIQEFPEVSSLPTCSFELQSGQCLYLPAGWFHEVVSFSSGVSKGTGDTHLAVNYWFFPPDSLSNFKFPYQDNFLQKRIKRM